MMLIASVGKAMGQAWLGQGLTGQFSPHPTMNAPATHQLKHGASRKKKASFTGHLSTSLWPYMFHPLLAGQGTR